MPTHPPGSRRGRRRRRTPRRRWQRALTTTAAVLAVVLVATGAVAFVAMEKLNGNIVSEAVEDKLGDRPEQVNQDATNILLIGSDTRAGQGGSFGNAVGARSDTTILLHLSEGREKATLVSIPRDSLVDVPACEREDGSMSEPTTTRFNAAFTTGGAACTIKTVESLTDVYVDHHMVIDFSGFRRMVNAMDGVEICLPEAVDDPDSGLDLPAGRHMVKGEDALAYARVRHIGDGSDLSRISRQQALMSAMIRRVKSSELLLNPQRLYGFLDAATKSITTDPELASLNELRQLAQSVKGMQTGQVRFVTVPNTPNDDGATVSWDPEADALWKSLREDTPLPGEKGKGDGEGEGDGGDSGPRELTVDPSDVRVTVLNGSGVPGLAGTAADELARAGFTVTGVGNADSFDYDRSVVRHGAGESESARTLTAAVQGAGAEQSPTGGAPLELVIGEDYVGVQDVAAGQTPPAATPTPSESVDARKASEKTCSI